MATGSKRKRNYANEYLIRIARGLTGGKSRSQARGHARAVDLPSNASPQPFKRSEPLEDALKLMEVDLTGYEEWLWLYALRRGYGAALRRIDTLRLRRRIKTSQGGARIGAEANDRYIHFCSRWGSVGQCVAWRAALPRALN
jgi:hypothetical protein